jgi:adenylyltransferase/sulfurtransferase
MAGDGEWRERFDRQLSLSQLGEEGQRALASATVVVVGAGGLGSNSADMLLRMGWGRVRVIDGDVVELGNLHRVRAYGEPDVGRPKVDVLAERMGGLITTGVLEVRGEELTADSAQGLLRGADVVLDGLDSMPARYLLNEACLELGVPWVYGGVVATSGLVAPFPAGGPCLRCLFPELPRPGALPTPETSGLHPSLPTLVASVQVALATRMLLDQLEVPRLVAVDIWSDDWRVMDLQQRADCPACVQGRRDHLGGDDGG